MLKEDFINKIKEKYPDNFNKYDYSLVPNEFVYDEKIKINCKSHGNFEQRVNNHLMGKKCPKCSNVYKPSTDEFIHKAREIHGDKYDYSKVKYINSKHEVKIICHKHGVFEQKPILHLKGYNCRKCSRDQVSIKFRSNVEEFISKANIVHNNKYSYNKVNYTNSITKVTITCPIHGDFNQRPSHHLDEHGCSKCSSEKLSNSQKSNTKIFISRSNKIHNYKYDYSKTIYIGVKDKVIITCPIHGDFEQEPSSHLNRNGCPKCRESKGEIYISSILEKYNIKYIREYKISGYNYRYDFYLPEYNIYIEYNGRQHYEIDDFFGGIKKFKKTQRNDKIKKELIKRSIGILIVIKYTFKTLEQIESELLRLFTILHPDFFNDKEITKQYIINSNIYLINNGIVYKRKLNEKTKFLSPK